MRIMTTTACLQRDGEMEWSTGVGNTKGTFARHAPSVRPYSMFRPSIPILYPRHTELGVPFSQLQKHKSFMHDWKKWW